MAHGLLGNGNASRESLHTIDELGLEPLQKSRFLIETYCELLAITDPDSPDFPFCWEEAVAIFRDARENGFIEDSYISSGTFDNIREQPRLAPLLNELDPLVDNARADSD